LVPQLNVYIPEDLAEVLQRHRDRLNLSQICARALRQEVRNMEAFTQTQATPDVAGVPPQVVPSRTGPPDVGRILQRLRGQQARQEAAARDGAEDAARWLEEAATIDEIRRVGEWTPDSDPGALDERAHVDLDRFYSRAFDRMLRRVRSVESSPWLRRRKEQLATGESTPDEYFPAYTKGWHQTVVAAWNEIKDQL
jgi:hypothetical protein